MVHPLLNFKTILYISFITVLIKLFKKNRVDNPNNFKVKIKIKGNINELKKINKLIPKINNKNNRTNNTDNTNNTENNTINNTVNSADTNNENINLVATDKQLTDEQKKELLESSLWDNSW